MTKALIQRNRSYSETRSLEEVLEEFKQWRASKSPRDRIPENLWEAAIELTETYPISTVSKKLHLGYYDLKERIDANANQLIATAQAPIFLELPHAQLNTPGECKIEMYTGKGAGLKITCSVDRQLNALPYWQTLLESQS